MLPAIDYFAIGLLLGLAFVIIVLFATMWRIKRRERRLSEQTPPDSVPRG